MRSTLVGEENETPFIRVWKPLRSSRVLKILKESPKGKVQRGQYLLAVGRGLGRYILSLHPHNSEVILVYNIQVICPCFSHIMQIMSMGAGLFMPPMMFPGGMPPMSAPHIYSPMGVGIGMGYGIAMPDMNGGSPGYPMAQMPHLQGTHFPSPSIPAQTVMHGMPGSNFHVLGLPGQGLPVSMPHGPIAPFPGRPFMTKSSVAVAPVESFGLAAACSSKDSPPKMNSPTVRNGGNDPLRTAPRQVCRFKF